MAPLYDGNALKAQKPHSRFLARPTDAQIARRQDRVLMLLGHRPRPEHIACVRCEAVFGEEDFNVRDLCPDCLAKAAPEPTREPNPPICYCRGCTGRVRSTEYNHAEGFCLACCAKAEAMFADRHAREVHPVSQVVTYDRDETFRRLVTGALS